ncbi:MULTISPECIES: sensor histidine kinase [unclassified Luteimonas]
MRQLEAWFRRPPIEDPVDRRNAPMLQIVLIVLGTTPVLAWLYRIFGTDIPWRPGESASLAASLVIVAVALSSLYLVRLGRFQWAIRQLLAVVAASMLFTYAAGGLSAQVYEQPIQVMWMFVAGMAIGRRALWAMYLVLALAMFLGAWTEATQAGNPAAALLVDAAIRSVIFLVIAVVVDRSTSALRDSLEAATRRGRELTLANLQLQAEIAARERTQEQLLHAQKVEAIGRMASGLAHDFNHLLALILGHVDQARHAGDPGRATEAVTGIELAARRAGALTHQLLNFSRYDATRAVRFDARDAMAELEPMLRQTLGRRIQLALILPPQPCPIIFDEAQFGLMLLNLASNSAQAIEGAGTFEVQLRPRPAQDSLEILVRDDGPGIPGELQARVLEPFFTTKPAGQGTGLGLFLVQRLVQESAGDMHLRSTPDTGTCITIRLPLAAVEDEAEDPADEVEASYQTSA